MHYHFRKKADLVAALLAEFQADARRVLVPPEVEPASLDDFWVFLHLLLELKAAYGFLFRDTESLAVDHPKVANALRHFARGLTATFELHLHALADSEVITLEEDDISLISRNLAVIALFSERFDALVDVSQNPDDSALRVAAAVLNVMKPFVVASASQQLAELAVHYEPA